MLSILTDKGHLPLNNRQNFNIVYDYEGGQTLSFDISPDDLYYRYIDEKAKLIYSDNRYSIRKINKRKTVSTITAELDLNEWKTRIHLNFHTEYDLFVDVIKLITPEGWVFDDAGAAKGRRAITLEGVTDYDVLMACKKAYGIAFEYHITERRIKVIDPLVVQECGLYLTEELNLDSVEYKGDFTQQANRLYAYGKKEEIENEDGTKMTTYVNFAEINHGKNYVDCMDYVSDEIVCAYWQDDRYTVPENLLTDAREKVRTLAYPVQAWNCNIHDLSRTDDMYKMLDFKLYDKPTLLTDGQAIVHQIVQYTDYPDNQNLNKVVLSTAFKKIQGEITEIKTNINDLDLDIKVKEYLINEIRRDVNSNTLLIRDTYRKGDIDTQLSSIIQQTEKDINLAVGEVKKDYYYQKVGAGNIYDDCAVSISKDDTIDTEVSLSTMPLTINKDVLKGCDIVISVDIYARNAVPKSLSGYMGAYFTVTYTDGTSKKYMTAYYPGARYLQQQLSLGTTSMYQRIYSTCRIDDKAIASVSNLTIAIGCNGEMLKVSNPKVEIGAEPANGELGTLVRMSKAEMQITPEAITQAVSEQIGSDGALKTAKYVFDKNGGHYYDGGIDIFNKNGEKVFYADTNGNLTLVKIIAVDGTFTGVIDGGEINGTTIRTNKDIHVGNNINLNFDDKQSIKWVAFNSHTGTRFFTSSLNGWGYETLSQLCCRPKTGHVMSHINMSSGTGPLGGGLELYVNSEDEDGNNLLIGSTITLSKNVINLRKALVSIDQNLMVDGNMTVRGAKNRVVYDHIEGRILMNAVESTYAVFEDYGTAILDENGRCVVRLDKRFLATVNANEPYFVFLTPLNEGNVYVKSKYNFAFVVAGTPDLHFDWRVTVKQKNYEDVRMKDLKKEGES